MNKTKIDPRSKKIKIISNILALVFLLFVLTILSLSKPFNLTRFSFLFIIIYAGILIHNVFILRPTLQNQKWGRYLILYLIYLLLVFPIFESVFALIANYLDTTAFDENHTLLRRYVSLVFFGMFVTFIGSFFYVLKYYITEQQVRIQAELAAENKQLQLLQNQLNPHLLFNSLNSIKALTAIDQERARDAIVMLSDFLRKLLQTTDRSIVSVREELSTLEKYIYLEQLRFGDRLRIEVQADDETLDLPIPFLSIQLLVENAIKHGVNKQLNGGIIKVKLSMEYQRLSVIVENPGKYVPEENSGIGVKNILERLKILYGNTASFTIANSLSNSVISKLLIPKKCLTNPN